VLTDFDGGIEALRGVVVQPNDKIVGAGWAQIAGLTRFALARYDANGSLDTSFGTGGKVTTSFGSPSAFGEGLVLQSDGKVVVAGGVQVGTSLDTGLARYNANGSLDSTFGSGGTVVHDLGGGRTDLPYSFIGLPDGTTVAGGLVQVAPTSNDMLAAHFNTSGGLVSSFGTGGVVKVDFSGGGDRLSALARLPNGNIVGAGYAGTGLVDNPYDSALIVLRPNGTLESAFSTDGRATFSVGKSDVLNGVVVVPGLFPQAPSRIAASGDVTDADGSYRCEALVVGLDGTLDPQFGTNGILRLPLSTAHDSYCGVTGLSSPPAGGRDLVLFGGEDLSNTDASVAGAEVFVDRVHSGCPPTTCRFFNGTSRRDKMKGTKGRDYMLGRAGNDTLIGGAGRNLLNGGPGVDRCVGKRKTNRFVSCERIRPR
jgi:uncharacterized delta-60 repeat protein